MRVSGVSPEGLGWSGYLVLAWCLNWKAQAKINHEPAINAFSTELDDIDTNYCGMILSLVLHNKSFFLFI